VDAAVVDEHPGAAVALRSMEELAGEVTASVVVPRRVLPDHEREVIHFTDNGTLACNPNQVPPPGN
jgi:hypothetical protein